MEDYSRGFSHSESINIDSITLDISGAELKNFARWASFKGIIDIISGSLVCLGIVTAAFGIPRILAGVKLLGAADELKRLISSGNHSRISAALSHMHKYFKFYGISIIVKLFFTVLFIIAYIVIIQFIISKFPDLLHNLPDYSF